MRFRHVIKAKLLGLLALLIMHNPSYANSTFFDKSAQVAVVTSSNLSVLTEQQIRSYFTLKQKLLPNKQKVRLVHLPLSNDISKQFTRKLFELYPYQLQRLWDRQVYSGKARPPKTVDDELLVLNYLVNNDNTIGYISAQSPLIAEFKGKINVIAVY